MQHRDLEHVLLFLVAKHTNAHITVIKNKKNKNKNHSNRSKLGQYQHKHIMRSVVLRHCAAAGRGAGVGVGRVLEGCVEDKRRERLFSFQRGDRSSAGVTVIRRDSRGPGAAALA